MIHKLDEVGERSHINRENGLYNRSLWRLFKMGLRSLLRTLKSPHSMSKSQVAKLSPLDIKELGSQARWLDPGGMASWSCEQAGGLTSFQLKQMTPAQLEQVLPKLGQKACSRIVTQLVSKELAQNLDTLLNQLRGVDWKLLGRLMASNTPKTIAQLLALLCLRAKDSQLVPFLEALPFKSLEEALSAEINLTEGALRQFCTQDRERSLASRRQINAELQQRELFLEGIKRFERRLNLTDHPKIRGQIYSELLEWLKDCALLPWLENLPDLQTICQLSALEQRQVIRTVMAALHQQAKKFHLQRLNAGELYGVSMKEVEEERMRLVIEVTAFSVEGKELMEQIAQCIQNLKLHFNVLHLRHRGGVNLQKVGLQLDQIQKQLNLREKLLGYLGYCRDQLRQLHDSVLAQDLLSKKMVEEQVMRWRHQPLSWLLFRRMARFGWDEKGDQKLSNLRDKLSDFCRAPQLVGIKEQCIHLQQLGQIVQQLADVERLLGRHGGREEAQIESCERLLKSWRCLQQELDCLVEEAVNMYEY